ncbi:MAG: methyltransferase domain-containing protein [Thermoplasmata archaeon]|nr:MAG: methyltransferase domain-containing protein [Thermoplasmata archaeon]
MEFVQQTIKTYDQIASEYCIKTRQQKFLDWEENYIMKMLSYISASNPLILDVGCGDGRHCLIIEKNGGRAEGVDLSDGMLNEAKKLYPKGSFRKMDMRKLDFEDGHFDGIWASGCIYHVPKSEVEDVILEFKRILKEQGIIAVNFKLGEGEGMEANPRSYSGSPRYFAYYSEEEMGDIFSKLDFEELESCTYPEEIFGDKIQQMWFRLKGR